jgi:hypothetical protein
VSYLRKLLYLSFLGYILFSQYLFFGYEKMNDKLQKVIDTLLIACINS